MSLIFKNKYLLFIFLTIYFLVGSYLSISNGITSDEHHEQLNWQINFNGILSFLKTGKYDELLNYGDRYHGIAFHYISQPFQLIFHKIIANLNNLTDFGGHLISKHFVVFLLFFISGIFFYLLSKKLTNNLNFCLLSTILYLLYPYLFGHAHFNPKDIPLLSFWVINTYISLIIIEDLYNEKKIKINQIILLAFLTSFLISIRVVGLVILLQYVIGFIVLFNIKKTSLNYFINNHLLKLIIFLILLLLFIYILNPILWHNPLEIVNSINWMSKYFNDICTLTLGNCMRSLNLPSSYYFIWLFFKLPLIILLGLALFPLVEKKIFNSKPSSIYYTTLLISFFLIIIIFIIKNVAIYDELRHVLFLVPMIFLIGLVNLFYFNKKLFNTLSIITIIFFILENFSLNPYQYTWLNSFAKFTDIEKNFEIDYWGVSNKNLSKKINEYAENNSINKDICVYGDIFAKHFLISKKFKCFKTYSQVDEAKERPFFAYKNLRNVKRSDPKDCTLIFNETYSYTFYKKKISVGTAWYCS